MADVAAVADSVGLAAFFLVGLLGGAHCLGMCGPLVTMYADSVGEDRLTWRAIRQHALFNAGRTVAYAVVGALLGLVGSLVYDTAAVVAVATPLRVAAGLTVGVVVLSTGVRYLRGGAGHDVSVPVVGSAFARIQAALADRVDAWAGGPRIAGLGVVHAALPCPLLYPAYLYALATGSPTTGALSLGALGLGTFPTLFAYGTAFGSLPASARARLHRGLGAAFVLLAFVPLTHALSLAGAPVPHVPLPTFGPWG